MVFTRSANDARPSVADFEASGRAPHFWRNLMPSMQRVLSAHRRGGAGEKSPYIANFVNIAKMLKHHLALKIMISIVGMRGIFYILKCRSDTLACPYILVLFLCMAYMHRHHQYQRNRLAIVVTFEGRRHKAW